MVVDTIKKLIFYFVNSKEPNEFAAETATTTEAPTTMSTAIAANGDDDVQSLYTIVENGLKDNVSIEYREYAKIYIDVFIIYDGCVRFAMVRNEILHLSILLLLVLVLSSLFFTMSIVHTPQLYCVFIYPNMNYIKFLSFH